MPQADPSRLAFDDVVIDFVGRRLMRAGDEQPLEPKAFAVLALLAGSPGRVFTRDELLDAVWGHRHVTQSVLNRIMSLLRQALDEDAQHPRLLHTVYGIGYRFDLPAAAGIAAVSAEPEGAPRWRQSRVIVSACVLLLTLGGVIWVQRNVSLEAPGEPIATQARPSLAVLPFADLSQARDQGYLADGLAEEIRNQLAQAPPLRVVGRTSSGAFKGRSEDLRAIGRALGVAYLLEGSVRREGSHLRVTAQLIRADDGSHLWSKTYARELRDVFAVQDEVARDVARALSVKLDVARFNREQGGTTQVDAYERFLRWRSIVMREQFDVEHDRLRLQLAREMVALDAQCVLCWDALAVSLNAMAEELDDVQADRLRAEALQIRNHIARIAPESWVARRDRSNALWREGSRAEAIALARQITDAGPLTKERTWDYAYMLYAMGHLEDTIALVEQVRATEPRALFLSRDLQYDYTAARRYPDAEAEYQRGLRLEGSQREPDYVAFFRQLAGRRPGGTPELQALHRRLLRYDGLDTPFLRDLGEVLDDREAMLVLVRRALADDAYAGGVEVAYTRTSVADALGDADLAVRSLRRELEAQPGFEDGTMAQHAYVAFWNVPYSGTRAHPDFKALLVKAGVVDYWRQTGRWGDGCGPVGADDFQCR
ncbi:winged helix-turn-helix domain-containing protein [Pseudoxanthomonas sp. SE1]|uniref:winged helix-turn-helix domain-containing protein n=1 Tax=Pseudoxanthomonas sp. SE1 TaxID=1664560 RepID=UPI00240E0D44|nr:winged helix-turn-helix domain-containing protein [Pseudoxanthomonas sp. SE1]WFC41778.1 winged helix-turn-helix domain-containing protein [Pseudoxanthomonas sp. SE1]